MENGVDYVEGLLKPTINEHIDVLASRAQMISLDREINNKLAALRKAGEELKSSVNSKVDNLMEQAIVKKPNAQDANFDEQMKIYARWLDQVTEGVKKVHSFFDRIWVKVKELLDKIFSWIKKGVINLAEKISKAFHIVKTTLFRSNEDEKLLILK